MIVISCRQTGWQRYRRRDSKALRANARKRRKGINPHASPVWDAPSAGRCEESLRKPFAIANSHKRTNTASSASWARDKIRFGISTAKIWLWNFARWFRPTKEKRIATTPSSDVRAKFQSQIFA